MPADARVLHLRTARQINSRALQKCSYQSNGKEGRHAQDSSRRMSRSSCLWFPSPAQLLEGRRAQQPWPGRR
jgi:hypothetical protein